MNSLVTNECGLGPKGFPTLTALKRPFSSVDFLVLNKVEFSNKGHSTFAAFMRPDSSVNFLVLNKYLLSAEAFPTLSALVVILSTFKGLSALGVPMWLPSTVRGLVLGEACAGLEDLFTLHACEDLLCHVSAAIHHK